MTYFVCVYNVHFKNTIFHSSLIVFKISMLRGIFGKIISNNEK